MSRVDAAGATYGRPRRWHRLYAQVTAEHHGLRDQLRALVQATHEGADPDDVQAVRSALFAVQRVSGQVR
jgi:hypothetical protein